MAPRPPYYPVTLDLRGRPCLVVGGGPVAARKADGLWASGARVTMVAPTFCAEAEALGRGRAERSGGVVLARRAYEPGEAARYRLVVTATGRAEVDGAVAGDAEAGGVWVNSADDVEHCTFILPSVHRDGPVSVAVSTGGASPALAGWLRRRAGVALGPGLGTLASLLDEARTAVRSAGRSSESVDWLEVLDGPLPELVAQGRLDQARALLAASTGATPPAGPPPEASGRT
ncbi:MAG: bifunctional precorrin-2 dehydrogenase/sirohydrochlorin ferrochelatase [Acidimicrobiales bacterium]